MTDLSKTILAKSDQMNADDLVGPMTITVTEVKEGSNQDQPITIRFQDDNGKPFKPCKTVRRILVRCWGADGQTYVGRQMTVYNEPTVTWAGQQVGGVRISHLSHIDEDMTIPLTVTRGVKKPYTVKKMDAPNGQTQTAPTPEDIAAAIARATEVAATEGTAKFRDWFNSDEGKKLRPLFKDDKSVMDKLAKDAAEADTTLTAGATDEIFGGDGE